MRNKTERVSFSILNDKKSEKGRLKIKVRKVTKTQK